MNVCWSLKSLSHRGDSRQVKGRKETRLSGRGVAWVLGVLSATACASEEPARVAAEQRLIENSSSRQLRVVTFNTGLASIGGCLDIVPCVQTRTRAQVEVLFGEAGVLSAHCGATRQGGYLTLALQEVWTREAFTAYQTAAQQRGCTVTPSAFEEMATNGQLTVTSEPIVSAWFVPFEVDDHGVQRGLRFVNILLQGTSITVANVHTTYSEPPTPSAVHLSQLKQVNAAMTTSPNEGARLVAGDVNAGPDLTYQDTTFSKELVWALWTRWFEKASPSSRDEGLNSTWARAGAATGEVTWDTSNPLVNKPAWPIRFKQWAHDGSWGKGSSTLDHVFFSQPLRLIKRTAGVVFAEPVFVEGCAGYRDPKNGALPLSDHYGWTATFSL